MGGRAAPGTDLCAASVSCLPRPGRWGPQGSETTRSHDWQWRLAEARISNDTHTWPFSVAFLLVSQFGLFHSTAAPGQADCLCGS